MKVLMLGWEYPPHHSGSLGLCCRGLTEALAQRGQEILFALPESRGDEPAAHMRMFSIFHGREVTQQIREHARTQSPDPAKKTGGLVKTLERDPLANGPGGGGPSQPPAFKTGKEEGSHRFFGKHSHYGSELLEQADRFTERALPMLGRLAFDLIHAHEWMNVPCALKLKQALQKKVIYHVHSLEAERSGELKNQIIDDLERWGLREADRVVTVSYRARDHLAERYGVPKEKIEVIHNGVSRAEGREQYHLKKTKQEKHVLFLGPLIFQKGPEYFVDAAAKVVRHFDKVKFIISGSGDKLEATMRRVNEWGLSKYFHFTGLLRGRQMEKVFTEADLYVMPSVFDPFEFAALEAVTYDTPVIISKQSGVAEILRHALKVDFWDVDKMAEQILAVLRYPALASDLVAMARRELLHLHWHAAAEKTQNLYHQVLSS